MRHDCRCYVLKLEVSADISPDWILWRTCVLVSLVWHLCGVRLARPRSRVCTQTARDVGKVSIWLLPGKNTLNLRRIFKKERQICPTVESVLFGKICQSLFRKQT